jgi:hypothetical protein
MTQLQQNVNRNYTTGFPGAIVRGGPHRAKSARITSATLGTDPGASTNRVSRAFGWTGEQGEVGGTTPTTGVVPAEVPEVIVGGAVFFGILGARLHYALHGDAASALDPSLDLPQYSEGEFFDMVTGLVVQLFNETTAVKAMAYGDGVAFVPSSISTGNNPLALPYGALVSVPAGSAAPTGMILIPNARIMTPQSLTASAAGTLVLANGIVQLTQ